jgi:hypothetical protein
MAVELLKEVYETPRAQVRGVFLCEDVAVEPTSVLTGGITQDGWDIYADEPVGQGADPAGDLSIVF